MSLVSSIQTAPWDSLWKPAGAGGHHCAPRMLPFHLIQAQALTLTLTLTLTFSLTCLPMAGRSLCSWSLHCGGQHRLAFLPSRGVEVLSTTLGQGQGQGKPLLGPGKFEERVQSGSGCTDK